MRPYSVHCFRTHKRQGFPLLRKYLGSVTSSSRTSSSTENEKIEEEKEPKISPDVRYLDGSPEKEVASKVFSKLGLSSKFVSYLASRFQYPTPIQEAAIPILLKGKSALLTSETGSGKTLAYLLPLLVRMQAFEQQRLMDTSRTHKAGPRIVVFSPTRELSNQIILQAKSISHEVKFKARLWGNKKLKLGKDIAPDLVVSSPQAFARDMKWNYSTIESVVFDECDAMLFKDSGFVPDINEFLGKVSPTSQIVCVGATALQGDSLRWLRHIRPEALLVKTKGSGYIPETIRIQTSPVLADEGYNKHPALERSLNQIIAAINQENKKIENPEENVKKCILFCNSISSCRSTHHILTSRPRLDKSVQTKTFNNMCSLVVLLEENPLQLASRCKGRISP